MFSTGLTMESLWYVLKAIFLCICGFLVAELVGVLIFTVSIVLSRNVSDFGFLQQVDKIAGSVVIGLPAAIYLTYGKVILMILCGAILRRWGVLYYLSAGAGVGYWQYLSLAKQSVLRSPFPESDFASSLTLSGLLAGFSFWFIAIRPRNSKGP